MVNFVVHSVESILSAAPQNRVAIVCPRGGAARAIARFVAIALCMMVSHTTFAEPATAIAMHGSPAIAGGFSHMPYTRADAPKGGKLVNCLPGTFDSLNPFIVKGSALQQIRGYVVESLMARGGDEPFTLYGLLADTIDTDDARGFATFHINPIARFADGKPVTARDVLFSWQLMRDHGRPNHRLYYAKVSKATALDASTVRFDFPEANDRELPLILGLMPIFAEHAIDMTTFENTSMSGLLGSGPYRVGDVRPGASVSLVRDANYWGRDLPINRGLWNFDEVRFDYYREANGSFEAFKRGLCDFRIETEPLRWHDGYDFPAVRSGDVVRDDIEIRVPQPSEFLVFNSRRAPFNDIRVRQALTLLFDFDWINRNYFFGLYGHSASYFAGSELSAYGRAAGERERTLLAPFPGSVRPDVMDGSYRLPGTDDETAQRSTLRAALALMKASGYVFDGTILKNAATGKPMSFEILIATREQERVALAYQRDLRRAGIDASVRSIDAAQFDQRRLSFDFDMIPNRWDQSLSPGNEQAFYWSSAAADNPGTRNYMGAKDPAVDAMIAALLEARQRPDFVDAVRALDRVLMSGAHAIPLYNVQRQWIARWNRIQRPETTALTGPLLETWWYRPP
jgi:peptide/nickel transport system substrate-binding protein